MRDEQVGGLWVLGPKERRVYRDSTNGFLDCMVGIEIWFPFSL